MVIFTEEYVKQSREHVHAADLVLSEGPTTLTHALGALGAYHLEQAGSFIGWQHALQSDMRGISDGLIVAAWRAIPQALNTRAAETSSTFQTQKERVLRLFAYRDQHEKWKALECDRKRLVNSPPSFVLALEAPVATENVERQKDFVIDSPSVFIPIEGSLRRSADPLPKDNRWFAIPAAILLVAAGFAWVLSPLGPLPSCLSVLLALRLAYKAHKKQTKLPTGLLLALCLWFTGVGIIHDATHPLEYMAQCRDGHYSSSEHHSGTCSWHGGVAVWNPTVRHWWQSLLGIG